MELVKLYKKLKVATNLMNCGREYCGRAFVMMNCGQNGQDFNGIIKKGNVSNRICRDYIKIAQVTSDHI